MTRPAASRPALAPAGALVLLALLGLLPSLAVARAPSLDGAPLVRHQRLMHDGRHAVTPSFGLTLNHPYQHHIQAQLRYDYYLANWIGLGFDVGYAFGFDNSLAKDVKSTVPDFVTSTLGLTAMAGATLVPLHGKFVFQGASSLRYDVFLRVSGGVVQLVGDGPIESGFAFAPRVGLGTHFFFGEQAAVVLELSDTLVSMHRSTTRDGGVLAKELHNLFAIQLGVLVHFPEKAEIRP